MNGKAFISLLFLTSCLFGQVDKIKVKKNNVCSYNLLADKEIINKKFEISALETAGLVNSNSLVVRLKSNLIIASDITINKDTLDNYLKNVCETSEYKLITVKVKRFGGPESVKISLLFIEK